MLNIGGAKTPFIIVPAELIVLSIDSSVLLFDPVSMAERLRVRLKVEFYSFSGGSTLQREKRTQIETMRPERVQWCLCLVEERKLQS